MQSTETQVNEGKLAGRCALVTGASSGIGRGVAIEFARQGARVAVNYPFEADRAAAEDVCRQIDALGAALPLPCAPTSRTKATSSA